MRYTTLHYKYCYGIIFHKQTRGKIISQNALFSLEKIAYRVFIYTQKMERNCDKWLPWLFVDFTKQLMLPSAPNSWLSNDCHICERTTFPLTYVLYRGFCQVLIILYLL